MVGNDQHWQCAVPLPAADTRTPCPKQTSADAADAEDCVPLGHWHCATRAIHTPTSQMDARIFKPTTTLCRISWITAKVHGGQRHFAGLYAFGVPLRMCSTSATDISGEGPSARNHSDTSEGWCGTLHGSHHQTRTDEKSNGCRFKFIHPYVFVSLRMHKLGPLLREQKNCAILGPVCTSTSKKEGAGERKNRPLQTNTPDGTQEVDLFEHFRPRQCH